MGLTGGDVGLAGMSPDHESSAHALFLLTASSLGATVLLLYEWIILLEHEVQYIWTKPNTAMTKWLYLFIRYFSIITQISIQIMFRVDAIQPDTPSVHLRHCPVHLIWPLVVAQSVLTAVELVLVWRVQALYPGRPLYLILGIVVVAETLTLAIIAVIDIPGISYNSMCEVNLPIGPVAVYGLIALLPQSVVLAMCIYRRMQLGWNKAPVVSLVMRDGALAYVAIFAFQIMAMYSLTAAKLSYFQFWLLAGLSAIGCRIIINLQQVNAIDEFDIVPSTHVTDATTGFELTLLEHARYTTCETETYTHF
ncbi:hypothetical protein FIBSPDRAFT_1039671 [Athelia psychrophila]|uniref:DUF6533 domain-containing protein n=1 Tax=Athelia psychrophila TaxID=1759441 RepID=A0A166RGG3_9AGAM|nr:hypothetical protein FIBSPDRAFT_1039671 [Fibularhizoctonia sp. CBS 109695]